MERIRGDDTREGWSLYHDQLITFDDHKKRKEDHLNEIKKLMGEDFKSAIKYCIKSSVHKRILGIFSIALQNLRISGSSPYAGIA